MICIYVIHQQMDTCFIDNKCFVSGDIAPNYACLSCNPLISTSSWTAKSGKEQFLCCIWQCIYTYIEMCSYFYFTNSLSKFKLLTLTLPGDRHVPAPLSSKQTMCNDYYFEWSYYYVYSWTHKTCRYWGCNN